MKMLDVSKVLVSSRVGDTEIEYDVVSGVGLAEHVSRHDLKSVTLDLPFAYDKFHCGTSESYFMCSMPVDATRYFRDYLLSLRTVSGDVVFDMHDAWSLEQVSDCLWAECVGRKLFSVPRGASSKWVGGDRVISKQGLSILVDMFPSVLNERFFWDCVILTWSACLSGYRISFGNPPSSERLPYLNRVHPEVLSKAQSVVNEAGKLSRRAKKGWEESRLKPRACILSGHGGEEADRWAVVPRGCTLVVTNEAGVLEGDPAVKRILSLFRNESAAVSDLLLSPSRKGSRVLLSSLIDSESGNQAAHVYKEGDRMPYLIYYPGSFNNASGVIQYPMRIPVAMSPYKLVTSDPAGVATLFQSSIYPTMLDVIQANTQNIENVDFQIPVHELMTRLGPGIFYFYACREGGVPGPRNPRTVTRTLRSDLTTATSFRDAAELTYKEKMRVERAVARLREAAQSGAGVAALGGRKRRK